MKKRVILIFILLISCLTVNACAKLDEFEAKVLNSSDSSIQPQAIFETEDKLLQEDKQKREVLGLTDTGIASLLEEQDGYAYQLLEDDLKPLYVEILTILQNREENVVVSSLQAKEIDRVFQCVLNDYPEIFYVNGCLFTEHKLEDKVVKISISGAYTMDEKAIESMSNQIDAYTAACLIGAPTGADAYEKVKYIYEYLVENTEYNIEAPENQNICSVFAYGESVCQGYAKAMQYLLDQVGVEVTLVTGRVENGESHAWNLVNIDGAYYYVDVTWGDASYVFRATGDEETGKVPTINYDYLCVTTDQLCKTHIIENVVTMPRCISVEANYYIREGAYFTGYDEEKTAALFQKAYEDGKGYVTLKCDSKEAYLEIEDVLLKEQKIFDFIQKVEGSIAYTGNEEQLTLSFWL